MRIFNCEICTYKPIIFGDLIANQFVLFEHKKLFGIIFFYFKGGYQDRFHTHAFNSISIKIFGEYMEGILDYNKDISIKQNIKYVNRRKIFKYFYKDSYHSINKSNGCMTILIQGPWDDVWKECKINDGFITEESILTWHRKKII